MATTLSRKPHKSEVKCKTITGFILRFYVSHQTGAPYCLLKAKSKTAYLLLRPFRFMASPITFLRLSLFLCCRLTERTSGIPSTVILSFTEAHILHLLQFEYPLLLLTLFIFVFPFVSTNSADYFTEQ